MIGLGVENRRREASGSRGVPLEVRKWDLRFGNGGSCFQLSGFGTARRLGFGPWEFCMA